jgi:hypothetical protein
LPGVPEDRSVTVHNTTPRTPGLKTLGFFVAQQKVMIETDSKKQREAEFTQKYTLSKEDFRKMILEKMERAKVYSKAVRKREIAHE